MGNRKVTKCAACGRRIRDHKPDLVLKDMGNGGRDRFVHTHCGDASYKVAAQKPTVYQLTVRHVEAVAN